MDSPRATTPAHAPGTPTYELHTLGWRAFQDLCATVLREVWGQSVQSFADSRDGGRDGAFYGIWHDTTKMIDLPNGPFVFQCKFIARRDQTLTLSTIAEELAKVSSLVKRGLCSSYVLMSNARVTGSSEAAIRKALQASGVAHPMILGGHWLNQTIAMNQRLRMFVPRVYGLGDLSQILDERAYAQARALLDYLQEDLSTFVVTDAYWRAARAVEDHGFCLLLGEPAVGKSVIAATLAVTALDRWHSPTIKADGPADIVAHWNPHEPNQFFWADDAFGQIRHERLLTDDWARRLPKVMAAIKGGAKIVLTSRDYIYREARKLLKEYAYPLLHEQQVVIDVAELSQRERRQILYNHIRLGDQPQAFRTAIKPYLSEAADHKPFRPEVARRLGNQSYTKGLSRTRFAVQEFMAKPSKFLRDVYEGLEPDLVGALAMVYQAGELPVPLGHPTTDQDDLLALIGSTYSGVAGALTALEGTFLRCSPKPGSMESQAYWTFRHPTLREGFASFVASNPNWIQLFIQGIGDEGILTRIDCSNGTSQGTLVTVPPALYGIVAERVASARTARVRGHDGWARLLAWADFLANRCSRRFLEEYLRLDPGLIARCARVGYYISDVPELPILAKLHVTGLLPEQQRAEARDAIGNLAVDIPDASWIDNASVDILLTEAERAAISERVKDELVPDLKKIMQNWEFNEQGESAEEYYRPLEGTLTHYAVMLRDDDRCVAAFQDALYEIEQLRSQASYWQKDDEDVDTPPTPASHGDSTEPPDLTVDDNTDRDVFQDVDE